MLFQAALRQAGSTFAFTFLAAAVCAVQANAQEPVKAPVKKSQPPSGKKPAAKTVTQAPQSAAPSAGMVVFVDPVTGKIRQPDAEEIGALTGSRASAQVAIESVPVTINGPGGAVGMKLGDDSLSYMVVTRTPDGKLAEDCVTGEKAASALAFKGVMPKTTAARKNAVVPDEK